MSLSKRELQDLAREVEKGTYVKKSTVYIVGVLALGIGLYIGNLISTLYAPAPHQAGVQQAPAQQSSVASVSDIPPQTLRRILDLEKQVQQTPGDVAAWTKLSHLYFDSNQYKKAIKGYTTVLNLKPNQPDILVDLGVMYRRDHQHNKAVEMFDKALSVAPKHEVAHFNKGIVLYYDLDKKQEAIGVWKKLLLINPAAKAPNGTPITEMLRQL